MATDDASENYRQYKVIRYPTVIKRKKEVMRIKNKGHAVSGSISPSTVDGRLTTGVTGLPTYVTRAFEYRSNGKKYVIKKKK